MKKMEKPMLKSESYSSAVDYLTGITGNLNTISSHLNLLSEQSYQPYIINAITGVQDQLSNLSTIHNHLPSIDHLAIASPIIDNSRLATNAFTGLSQSFKIPENINSIAHALPSWYEETMVRPSALYTPTLPAIGIQKVNETFNELIGVDSLSSYTIQSSIAKATELSVFAEKSLYSINSDNLGSAIGLFPDSKDMLSSSFDALSTGYTGLIKSFDDNPLTYTELHPSISRCVPSEYFLGSNLLETISVREEICVEEEIAKSEIQYENESTLSEYLPRINDGLYKMWKGAIEAYHSDNPDRVRHFSTSIRELFTHVIHNLAPDNEIKNWSKEESFYHLGRPTRKVRLNYICRNISNDSFKTFVKKDVDATLAFIDIFQKGTHEIEPSFTTDQLAAIRNKAESILKFILEIQYKSN